MDTTVSKNLSELVCGDSYGGISPLVLYLALIPDGERASKMWGYLLSKKLDQRSHLCALVDHSNPGEKKADLKKLKSFDLRLADEVKQVREVLGIEPDKEAIADLIFEFTFMYNEPVLLKDIAGEQWRVGANLLRKLTAPQAEYLYEELVKFKFIEGDKAHFLDMFSGEGVLLGLFEPIKWLPDNKQTLRQLLMGQSENTKTGKKEIKGLRFEGVPEKDIPGVSSIFFRDKKGNPTKAHKKGPNEKEKGYDGLKIKIDNINKILENLMTL